MEPPALTEFLGHQRWFAGKGRAWELAGVSTIACLQEKSPRVTIEAVTVEYGDGEVDTYQLPLATYDEEQEHLAHALVATGVDPEGGDGGAVDGGGDATRWHYDALHDKDVTNLWLEGIAGRLGEVPGLTFAHSRQDADVPLGEPSLVIGAEQSNTSVIFGGAGIMKVFRRVFPGRNPDIEIHEVLAARDVPHIARPMGSLEGTWRLPDGTEQTGSLAMLQEFLKDGSEGWDLAKASVRDLLAEGDLHADEVGGDFAGESRRLGVATAEVHAELAAALGSDTLSADALDRLAAGMQTRLDRAAAEVPALSPYSDRLRRRFEALRAAPRPVQVQRVHGDYHLGQVMRTLHGWRLLDFEGEPAKPLEERRGMDSPLKDVAGMLRSFDYAARHLLADRANEPHLAYRAAEWAQRNRNAFCAGYAEVAGRDPREDEEVLNAFEADKAVYEVVYEARNRPSWLGIPMSAIERLAEAPAKETT